MADFAIYWKNYVKDCEFYGFGPSKPLDDWRTSSRWLYEQLLPGDRLWFFSAGEVLGGNVGTAAYLVSVFRVREMVENHGDDPNYSCDEFRYTIWADSDTCAWVDPPILADTIVRPKGHAIDVHIGKLMQHPRRLPDESTIALETLVT